MAENIDEKVVKLTVENEQFESKIKQSSGSLEKFAQLVTKTAVQTTIGPGVQNFFSALGNALGNGLFYRSLSSVSSGVEEIQMKFTSLGIIGKRVLENLTDSAISLARNGIMYLFNGIKEGGLSRAMNIEKAKFQIEGLGIAWKEVAGDINYGVESTAYGLDAAAMAASQLAASGVQFGGVYEEGAKNVSEMGQALRAISGVAAMTSSSYEDISRIFTTVAGNGRMMGDQLLQMSSRGLNAASELAKFFNKVNDGSVEATEDVQKAIKELTKGLNIGESEIRDFVSKGKINFAMFSQAMDSAFGEHAKDANKTLEGSLSNVRAAMSKIGALFFQPLIAEEGPLVRIINAFREKLNLFKSQITPVMESVTTYINKVFSIVADLIEKLNFNIPALKVIDIFYTVIQGIYNIANNLIIVFKVLGAAFKSVFSQDIVSIIKDTINNILNFARTFKLSSEILQKFYSIFRGIFGVLNIFIDLIKSIYTIVSPLTPQLKELAMIFLDIFANIGESINQFSSVHKLSNLINNSINNFTAFGNTIEWVKGILDDLIGFFSNFGKKKESSMSSALDGIADEKQVKKTVTLIDMLKMALNSFKSVLSNAKTFIGNFVNEIKQYVPFIENIKNVIKESYEQIKSVLTTESGSRALQGLLIDGGFIGVLITGYGLLKKEIKDIEKEGLGKNFIDKLLGKDFIKNLTAKSKNFDRLMKRASDLLNSTKKAIDQFNKNLQLDGIMKVAKALAILAGSLLVLSFISPDRIFGVLVMVSVLFTALNMTIKQFDKLSLESAGNIAVVNTALVSFAAAILILSISLGMISKSIGKNGLGTSLFGLFELLVLMEGMLNVYRKIGKLNPGDLNRSKSVLTTFAISMLILSGVLKILSTLSIGKGLFALAILRVLMENMVEVFRRVSIINKREGEVKKVSKVFMSFSLSMVILGAALKLMSSNTFAGGTLSLIAFKLLLEDMIIVIEKLSKINKNSKSIGKSSSAILVFSGSLVIIATAIKKMASLGIAESIISIALIAGLLEEFVRIIGLFANINSKTIAKGLLAIGGMSAIVALLSLSLKQMALAEINDALSVFGIISGLLFEVTAILSWFGSVQVDPAGMQAFAVAISLLGSMIASFAHAIEVASEVDDVQKISRVVEGMIVIAGSTAILMVLLSEVSKYADPTKMFGVAGAMIAMSTAMLIFAAAIEVMAEPIERLSKIGFKGAYTFFMVLTSLVGVLALLGLSSQLGVEFLGFVYAGVVAFYLLAKAVETVYHAYAMLGNMIANLINSWSELIKTFLLFKDVSGKELDNIINAMLAVSGAMNIVAANMGSSAVIFITSFVGGILGALDEIINPIKIILNGILPIITSVWIAMLKEVLRITREIAPVGMETLMVLLGVLDQWMPELLAKVYDIYITIVQFMTEHVNEFAEIAVTYSITFLDAFMNTLANHMPEIGALIQTYYSTFLMAITQMILRLILELINKIVEANVNVIGVMSALMESIRVKITDFANEIIDKFTFLPEEMANIGKDVLGGLITGLTDGNLLGKILKTAYNIGTTVVDSMREALDSHSDSKETIAVGNDTGHGLITGLLQQIPGINKISNFIGKIVPEGISEGIEEGSGSIDNSADVVNDILDSMAINAEDSASRAKYATAEALKAAQEAANHEKYINSIRLKGGVASQEMSKGLERQNRALKDNEKSTNDANNATKNYTGSLEKAGKGAKGAAKDVDSLTESFKSMEELQSSLQEKIKGSIDIFSEFSHESDLSADKLLSNMRSQVEGVKEWSKNLQTLGARGIEKGLLQKLAELGPQGWDKVQAFVQMTDDQLKEANSLFAQSLMLPESESSKIVSSFAQNGMWAAQGLIDGIPVNAIYDVGMTMGTALDDGTKAALGIHSPSQVMFDNAVNIGQGVINGIIYMIGKIQPLGAQMGRAIITGFNSAMGKATMFNVGKSVVNSFAIAFTKTKVINEAIKAFCDNIRVAIEKGLLDTHYIEIAELMMDNIILGYQNGVTKFIAEIDLQNKTISDKMYEAFEEIGTYCAEGLKDGLENSIEEVAKATIKMCKASIKSAHEEFDSNSPSKVFEELGKFIGIGLANGIKNSTGNAVSATTTMADSTISKFQTALNRVHDYVQNGMDDNLTITPVLDLSNVESGLNNMNSMMGSKRLNLSTTLDNASRIAAAFNGSASGTIGPKNNTVQNNYTFNQTNTSPKALSNAEIYRQTNNLINRYRSDIGYA